jgi:hypothetical protein
VIVFLCGFRIDRYNKDILEYIFIYHRLFVCNYFYMKKGFVCNYHAYSFNPKQKIPTFKVFFDCYCFFQWVADSCCEGEGAMIIC